MFAKQERRLQNWITIPMLACFSHSLQLLLIFTIATMRVGTGHHVIFDEAHMSVPANRAPLAVESLQRLGYYSREAWIDDDIKSEMSSDIRNTIQVELRTDSATPPSRGTVDFIGFDLFLP